ncbi:MAG: preprotein translocase subunit YajC [Acidimicrobiales bacterium]
MELLPLVLIFGVAYFVLILPQQRRNRDHRALMASLAVGDEVVLNSGIYGFISGIEGDILWLEVAERVELKVSRSAVQAKIPDPAGADAAADADAKPEKNEPKADRPVEPDDADTTGEAD